jgi:hypothetical protein
LISKLNFHNFLKVYIADVSADPFEFYVSNVNATCHRQIVHYLVSH